MRDTPADLISVKIGINLVNTDVMRLRAFDPPSTASSTPSATATPTTPLLVVSPILCPIHEDTPGPSALDARRPRAQGGCASGPRATPPTAPAGS